MSIVFLDDIPPRRSMALSHAGIRDQCSARAWSYERELGTATVPTDDLIVRITCAIKEETTQKRLDQMFAELKQGGLSMKKTHKPKLLPW